ncbi:DNA polymerase nu [Pelobates cultripes]|uniref:DNA polymerase nu n=1 Tax=Pelobates cultripes TaxID=61616 RepID=A0AAD1SGX3_PELCU|nr:DNA polymerase nu [Pelobates cultripes]
MARSTGKVEKVVSNDLTAIELKITGKTGQQKVLPLDFITPVSSKAAGKHQEQQALLSLDNTFSANEKRKKLVANSKNVNTFLQNVDECIDKDGSKYPLKVSQEGVNCADPQILDLGFINQEEEYKLLEEIKQARALLLTMVFADGSSQLTPKKDSVLFVKGFIVLVKQQEDNTLCNPVNNEHSVSVKPDKYFYMAVGGHAFWEKDEAQNTFSRNLLLSILQSRTPAICFNAKDFLRTVLSDRNVSWKTGTKGAGQPKLLKSVVFDPSIAAWLLNPEDCSPSFYDLVKRYCGKADIYQAGSSGEMQLAPIQTSYQDICRSLDALYALMVKIQSNLQLEGLWDLFCTIELPLISILAVMESHRIQVNQEELKKTSELLGICLKELEHEAHHAAGEKFRLTSSKDVREILFDHLHLHLQCKSKLPRTNHGHFPSTAESVVLQTLQQLQDLHPLPKIILDFRQMQKIKSTYVDGLLSCMTKYIALSGESHVSSTWNQTGTVSGRLSAKHPNIQGIPKLPVEIVKPQYIQGKERETVTITPRSMFTSAKGYTFLTAGINFSQIELRLIAHFSSDPELLKLFQETDSTDVFTKLAAQWKDITIEHVTVVDREQAKRVAYSVIYGAGKERLSECLGITPAEANAFIERFLQKYRVSDFTQRVIHQCHNNGFVVSLMGRKRPLPKINAQNYSLRAQAGRQAVNFVIQGEMQTSKSYSANDNHHYFVLYIHGLSHGTLETGVVRASR